MLELLTRQIATPTSPAHRPQILCILIGQERTCQYFSHRQRRIDIIMFLLEACLLFLYLIYMAKKVFLRHVHYKELRVFAPFENSYALQ